MERTGGWMKTYRMVEEKPHEIIIHWGNGRTDKFTLKLDPVQSLYPIQWLRAYYENTNGTKSKLEPLGQSTNLIYTSITASASLHT